MLSSKHMTMVVVIRTDWQGQRSTHTTQEPPINTIPLCTTDKSQRLSVTYSNTLLTYSSQQLSNIQWYHLQ